MIPRAPSTLTLTLPWAVLVPDNAKYGVFGGRMLLSDRYRAAKQQASYLALEQRVRARSASLAGRLVLTATFYPPDKRRRDLTNHAKLIHDALEGVCFADDEQLDDVRYLRGPIDRTDPRVVITISEAA